MKIQHTLLALVLSAPMVVFAQDMAKTPAQQEYMAGMQKMHSGMMAGMNESNPDMAFAKGMKAHHEGAIAMAQTELKYGKDPEMRKLAQTIIDAQQGEIDQMQKWIGDHK